MTQSLYSSAELEPILEQASTLLVAVLSQEDYDAGHIPNSQLVLPSELTCNEKPAPGLLPSQASLHATLERLGVSKELNIIVYDNAGGSVAGRFIWTLALFGFHNTALLDGGLKAWQAANLTLTQSSQPRAASQFECQFDPAQLADKSQVLASLETAGIIWDARGLDEYQGDKVLAARGGHIPGAICFDWQRLHTAHTCLKPLPIILEELQAAGIDGSQPIITHCQTHRRSGLTWFVAHRLLGWPVKAYAGSWSEWGNDLSLPIE